MPAKSEIRTGPGYTAILLGASGNVGGQILRELVERPSCRKVLVATRRDLGKFPSLKVQQVIVDMDRLEADLAPHVQGVDIAFAAFGVGKGSAKMPDEQLRRIEVTYPTAFAAAAKSGGARVMALMTAAGANPKSSVRYVRVIGEKEERAKGLKFDFLGLYRPGVILGNSNTPSALGLVMPLVHWAIPSRYHSIRKDELARAMVARSEEALINLEQSRGPAPPAVQTLEYGEMRPYFEGSHEDRT